MFLRVYRTLASYRSAYGGFATWMTSVTRNLLIDHYRRTKRDRITDSLDDKMAIVENKESSGRRPDQQALLGELSGQVQAALTRLSPELREAVILRDLQQLEYAEIQQVLEVPEGTVKSRINRGESNWQGSCNKWEWVRREKGKAIGGFIGESVMTWTCDQIEARLSDYLDGLLQGPERATFDEHLAGCAECAPLLASVRSVVSGMQAMKPIDAPPRLIYAILDQTLGPRETVTAWQAVGNFLRGLASPKFAYGAASVMATCVDRADSIGILTEENEVGGFAANEYLSHDAAARASGLREGGDQVLHVASGE